MAIIKNYAKNAARHRPAPRRSAPLGRAFQVLSVLIEAIRPMSTIEIAQRCELDTSTVHRMLQSLAFEGYVLREESTKRYFGHPRLLLPLPVYHPWNVSRRDAGPALIALRDQLGFTTGLIVFCLGQRILLELAVGRDPLGPDYQTCLSSPLHASGSGKVMLMGMSVAARQRALGAEPYERFTPKTATVAEFLDRELAEAEKRGYVLACDDYVPGFRVVAAPLRAGSTIVGCLFSSGRSTGLSDDALPQVGSAIRQSAEFLSVALPSLRNLADLLGDTPP